MALVLEDLERINAALPRLYRELEAEGQGRVMMELIREFVPAASIFINRLEVASGDYKVVGWPANIYTDEQIRETGRYLDQSPFPAYHVATGDPSWKMTTDFMPLEDFRRTDLYDSMRCWNIEAQMCALLAFVDNTAHALTVHRSTGSFSEWDREILNALHPHFVTSYLNVLSFEKADRSIHQLRHLIDQAPGAYGYLEKNGEVAWMQPRAGEWVIEFFGMGTSRVGTLPGELGALMRGLISGKRDAGYMERTSGPDTLFVCIAASPMGGWILRLEKKSQALLPRFRALPEFTPRVNEVLGWMVEGKRNSEIATILRISERTVEKYVAVVLESFGVENRATAIVRAMETYARFVRE